MRGEGVSPTVKKAPSPFDLQFGTFGLFFAPFRAFLSQVALIWRRFCFFVSRAVSFVLLADSVKFCAPVEQQTLTTFGD